MKFYRFARAPRRLRRPGIKLDNIALVPASMLQYKRQYQAIANSLPSDSLLIYRPISGSVHKKVLKRVAALFESRGRPVTVLSEKRMLMFK